MGPQNEDVYMGSGVGIEVQPVVSEAGDKVDWIGSVEVTNENSAQPLFSIGDNNEIVWKQFEGELDKKRRGVDFLENNLQQNGQLQQQDGQFQEMKGDYQAQNEMHFQENQDFPQFQPNHQFQQQVQPDQRYHPVGFQPNQFQHFDQFQQPVHQFNQQGMFNNE